MPINLSPTVIGDRIQKLLTERQLHADALASIDAKLGQINGVLGGALATAAKKAAAPVKEAAPKRRKRRKFAVRGDLSIVEFVKKNHGATTAEIQKHWQSEGRGGKADNYITTLVKQKTLKRTPLVDQRGSRYTVA